MGKPVLMPTGNDNYVIAYAPADGGDNFDFTEALNHSRKQEQERDFEGACNTRLKAFQRLVELIPDDDPTTLEWEDNATQAAIETGYYSGIDHFLINDWEMAAAIFEMILDIDPEDHLEATIPLSYLYIALEEYESFDDIINDVNDKYIDKVILTLWSEFRRTGKLPHGEIIRMKSKFKPFYDEFTASEHPADERYMKDILSERSSREAQARELWLKTEHLWAAYPDFIEALSKA